MTPIDLGDATVIITREAWWLFNAIALPIAALLWWLLLRWAR
jgi:hypothetical protein